MIQSPKCLIIGHYKEPYVDVYHVENNEWVSTEAISHTAWVSTTDYFLPFLCAICVHVNNKIVIHGWCCLKYSDWSNSCSQNWDVVRNTNLTTSVCGHWDQVLIFWHDSVTAVNMSLYDWMLWVTVVTMARQTNYLSELDKKNKTMTEEQKNNLLWGGSCDSRGPASCFQRSCSQAETLSRCYQRPTARLNSTALYLSFLSTEK